MVVDIQGVDDVYTDPQIHTADGKASGRRARRCRGVGEERRRAGAEGEGAEGAEGAYGAKQGSGRACGAEGGEGGLVMQRRG